MKSIFQVGNKKTYTKIIGNEDIAKFESGAVHEVYATFALGRDAEWSSRLFVLEMKEAEEEGIGTFLNIIHRAPALVGETVTFEAEIISLVSNNVNCWINVRVGERLIAECSTGQKIIKKDKLDLLFESLGAK